jgi:hypothetical protein
MIYILYFLSIFFSKYFFYLYIYLKNTKYLSKHAFKITSVDARSSAEITGNIRLLREVPPSFDPPHFHQSRDEWNTSGLLKGAGLGSMVKSINSNTTWKRKYTLY